MERNLIICTDGTWNTPDQTDRGRVVPSNVVKICRATAGLTSSNVEQIVYYDTGVGTGGFADRITGGMFGTGFSDNVIQAYRALGNAFRPDDKIFLFGFSRGAYTARSLAGLIGLCGIPLAGSDDTAIDRAYQIYKSRPGSRRDADAVEHMKSDSHKSDNGEPINKIHFIGVWDTVGALGVPHDRLNFIGRNKHEFHDPTLGAHIANAFHAMALEEKRKPFAPTLWVQKNANELQNVEQMWFTGVHSNVGGGYVDSGLSDRALLWMCLKARDAGMGLRGEYLSARIDPNYHGELRDSKTALYKFLGDGTRPIGSKWQVPGISGSYPAARERIHFSVRDRYRHATNKFYRQKSANPALAALASGQSVNNVPVAEPMDGELNYHNGAEIDWNEKPGAPSPKDFTD